MIIAQISDTHIDPAHENGPARLGDLEACVEDINALEPAPDLVIHTGDMAHDGDEDKYRLALGILKNLKMPLFICAGNRDERSLLTERFSIGRRLMPDAPYVQYVVDDFPVRLVALDTLSEQSNQGSYCQDRADNLRGYLSSDTSKPTVVFMHHPPFEIEESAYPRQFESWESAERLAGALKGQNHVVRGFCGHSHRHAVGTVAGIPFSTVPSVARDLRLGDFAPEMTDTPVYHLHTFNGEDAFRTEIRPASKRAFTV
ncbi:metallophosphoesterase [Thalassospiraceae bacterium LMO-JJ14]|nr:metallophosphoesterase [Thalassospiraceae bacterium LMO-JJ14]